MLTIFVLIILSLEVYALQIPLQGNIHPLLICASYIPYGRPTETNNE